MDYTERWDVAVGVAMLIAWLTGKPEVVVPRGFWPRGETGA